MKNKYGWLSLIFLTLTVGFFFLGWINVNEERHLGIAIIIALSQGALLFLAIASIVFGIIALKKKENKIIPWISLGIMIGGFIYWIITFIVAISGVPGVKF